MEAEEIIKKYDIMLMKSEEFADFVDSLKDMTTDEIKEKYNVKLSYNCLKNSKNGITTSSIA